MGIVAVLVKGSILDTNLIKWRIGPWFLGTDQQRFIMRMLSFKRTKQNKQHTSQFIIPITSFCPPSAVAAIKISPNILVLGLTVNTLLLQKSPVSYKLITNGWCIHSDAVQNPSMHPHTALIQC